MPVPPSSPIAFLPLRPDWEFYFDGALALLHALRAGEPEAVARFVAQNSPISNSEKPSRIFRLKDAQRVIAREHGFVSWWRFEQYIYKARGIVFLRPYILDINWHEAQAQGLLRAHADRVPSLQLTIRYFHPKLATVLDGQFALDDARLALAVQHGFEGWAEFQRHLKRRRNSKKPDPFLAAFEALKAGDEPLFLELLEQHPDLSRQPGSNRDTLLSLAVGFRRSDACHALLKAEANPNFGNNYGWTPLHEAASSGQLKLVKYLIKRGASTHYSARGEGGTPLVQALFWGHSDTADFLAGRHAVNPWNLRTAAGLGRLVLLQEFFTTKGQLKKQAGKSRGFYRPHDGFPNWHPSDDPQEILNEALTYAARNGRDEAVRFLLEKGANIHADPYRGTALHWAAYTGRLSTVRLLVELGADVNQRATFAGHGDGVTPMHMPAQNGQIEMVRLLVELGGDPNLLDSVYLGTPSGWASFGEHTELARYLVDLPQSGILALAAAGRIERVRELLDQNPALKEGTPDETRIRPLHRAAEVNQIPVVQLLIDRGADLNSLNIHGETALDLALKYKHQEMAVLLKAAGARTAAHS